MSIKMRIIHTFAILLFSITVSAQEFGKNIGSVSVAFDGKAPKEYKHKDDAITITVEDVAMGYVYFNARNNSDKAITFQWPTSYYVISEETIPMLDVENYAAWTTGLTINENTPTVIAPESKVVLKCTAKGSTLFDYFKANKYFKENDKMPRDRAVLQFEIDGAKVEKVIPIEVYTKKIRKALKK